MDMEQRISNEIRLKYNSERKLGGTSSSLIDVTFVILDGAKIGAHKFILLDNPFSEYFLEKLSDTKGFVVIDLPRDITLEALDSVLSYIYGVPINEILRIGNTSIIDAEQVSALLRALNYFKIDNEVVWTKLLKASEFWLLKTQTIYKLAQSLSLEPEIVQDAFLDWIYLDKLNRFKQFSTRLCQLRAFYKYGIQQDSSSDNDEADGNLESGNAENRNEANVCTDNPRSKEILSTSTTAIINNRLEKDQRHQNEPSTSTSSNIQKRPIIEPENSTLNSSPAAKKSKTAEIIQINFSSSGPVNITNSSESKWLGSIKTLRSPYYPQIGDELVYFRQGHELYINTVKSLNLYKLDPKFIICIPFIANPTLPAQVSCRLVKIFYESKPPSGTILVKLELEAIDWGSKKVSKPHVYYQVSYHHVRGVDDFLILRQHYDKSLICKWNIGDRFQNLIGSKYMFGSILDIVPFSTEFPDSQFRRYKIVCDIGEEEKVLSLWELELCLQDTAKQTVLNKATPEEIRNYIFDIYEPNPSDWSPNGNRDSECERILSELLSISKTPVAKPLLSLPSRKYFPEYYTEILCPMSLSIIAKRLKSRFYRRKEAIRYDIKLLNSNVVKYNQPDDQIVPMSRTVGNMLLRII